MAVPGLFMVALLALPVAALPGNHWWLRRFQTPPVSNERVIAQEFTMPLDGLNQIEFRPVRTGTAPSGDVRLSLVEIQSDSQPVVRTASIQADVLARASLYRFQFAPIADSQHRKYRFEIAATENSGVALLATKGDWYPDGALTVNRRARWADLVFQVSAPTTAIWRALWTSRAGSGTSGRIVLTLLILSGLAVGPLLHAVGAVPGPRSPVPPAAR